MKKAFKFVAWLIGIFILVVAIALIVDISNDDNEQKVDKEIENHQVEKKDGKEKSNNIGKDAVKALESNDFEIFVEEYKKLGSNKTTVWDNQLYGKKVTWTGSIVRVGTSQLFVYGKDDYKGEDWSTLGDNKQLFYAFTAKYSDKNQFKSLSTGDKVTVNGVLKSRGDLDLNFNWKLYDVELVK